MAKKQKYRIGMEIKSGRKKFLVLKVNNKTIIMREFKRKTKGNIISLNFGDKYEFSHVLTGYKYGIVNHGKIFIKTFNKILRFYYKIAKKKKYKSGIIKYIVA